MLTKKKMPRFYLVLIICWAVALTLLGTALLIVRSYLADFESTQPKYVAEEVFEKYFSGADFEAVLAFSAENGSAFESNETLAAYLMELISGKELSYHSISSGMDLDSSKYIVKYSEEVGDVKIASFTLEKTGEKSKKGFAKYALSDIELFYPAEKTVKIKVLQGSVPYVNGVALDDSHIKEENVAHDSCKHMPEGVNGIYYTVYELQGLVKEPEVAVTDTNGSPLTVFFNEKESCYETALLYDETLMAEQSERVIAAAKNYAAYMQNDLALNKLNPYFEKGTELYNSIRSTLQWAVIDHDSYHFEDIEASEFYRYDDNTFSCRVKLTHVLKRSRLEDYRDSMDVTFYLRKVGNDYLVYDRVNN
ncbi:MAG: hypothetical protein E7671_02270 [Ruminococcaceae bacterium]|nr:hypothetical protein [Oscillospiraceae bacterium]